MEENDELCVWVGDDVLTKTFENSNLYTIARVAWTYERKAYLFAVIRQENAYKENFLERYEATKAARIYEVAARMRGAIKNKE